MFADSFDECTPSGLVVATLDVELAEQWFKGARCYQSHPRFQHVDGRRAGAELFEDVGREATLEVPGVVVIATREYHRSPTIVALVKSLGFHWLGTSSPGR